MNISVCDLGRIGKTKLDLFIEGSGNQSNIKNVKKLLLKKYFNHTICLNLILHEKIIEYTNGII